MVKVGAFASRAFASRSGRMSNEGLVASIEEGVAEIAARAFWQAQVESMMRRDMVITEETEELAARLLQARWRARKTRRQLRTKLKKVKLARGVAAGGAGAAGSNPILDVAVSAAPESVEPAGSGEPASGAPAGSAVAQRPVVGVAPGALLQRRAVVPLVRAVLLSPPQAAAAVARGVALAVADIFGSCRALSRVCARGSRVLERARAHALVYGIPMYV